MNSVLKVKGRSEQKKAIINNNKIESNEKQLKGNEVMVFSNTIANTHLKATKKRAKVDAKTDSKTETRTGTKRAKTAKDPMAPKRAISAFILFGNDERKRLKTEKPDLAFGEIGKELGKRWKDSTEDVKNKYQALAQIDKERYVQEMDQYRQLRSN